MGHLVNLRIARKRAKRRRADGDAASNRILHGRSKAERALQRSRSDKATLLLDQHRLEAEDRQ